MKNYRLVLFLIAIFGVLASAKASGSFEFGKYADKFLAKTEDDKKAEIEWLDFETAIEKNNNDKKKFIFIDIYTNWCGWCKKMDATTFMDSEVIEYMNERFYCVKMDAEAKEAIVYKEHLYETKVYGNRSYNELAVNLLGGSMSFPSFVVLSKREAKLGVIKGYQKPAELIRALKRYTKDK